MQVYLLRHGHAVDNTSDDSSRQLSSTGAEDVASVARSFAETGQVIQCCFVSPILRAQQTAKIFLSIAAPDCEKENSELLLPDTSAHSVVRFLHTLKQQDILLVSHNPMLSELHQLLIQSKEDFPKVMSPGELCVIQFDVFGAGLGKEVCNLQPAGHRSAH